MIDAAKRCVGSRATARLRCLVHGYPHPNRFLDTHRAAITGDVLEVQVDTDAHRFGHDLRRSAWPGAAIEFAGHGNCLAAVAAQMGLALEELSEAELDVHDPRYPVLTSMCCRTPA